MNRTRTVRWLRVLLPLLALAMLSTLFLFSRGSDGESQIPYADVDAEAMARDPRLVAPEYAGVTPDGAQLTLRATEAAPARAGCQPGNFTILPRSSSHSANQGARRASRKLNAVAAPNRSVHASWQAQAGPGREGCRRAGPNGP